MWPDSIADVIIDVIPQETPRDREKVFKETLIKHWCCTEGNTRSGCTSYLSKCFSSDTSTSLSWTSPLIHQMYKRHLGHRACYWPSFTFSERLAGVVKSYKKLLLLLLHEYWSFVIILVYSGLSGEISVVYWNTLSCMLLCLNVEKKVQLLKSFGWVSALVVKIQPTIICSFYLEQQRNQKALTWLRLNRSFALSFYSSQTNTPFPPPAARLWPRSPQPVQLGG